MKVAAFALVAILAVHANASPLLGLGKVIGNIGNAAKGALHETVAGLETIGDGVNKALIGTLEEFDDTTKNVTKLVVGKGKKDVETTVEFGNTLGKGTGQIVTGVVNGVTGLVGAVLDGSKKTIGVVAQGTGKLVSEVGEGLESVGDKLADKKDDTPVKTGPAETPEEPKAPVETAPAPSEEGPKAPVVPVKSDKDDTVVAPH